MDQLLLACFGALSVLATAASVYAVYCASPSALRALHLEVEGLRRDLEDVVERRIPAAQEQADRTLATAELENEQAETRRRRAAALVSKLPKDEPDDAGNGELPPEQLRRHLEAYFRGR